MATTGVVAACASGRLDHATRERTALIVLAADSAKSGSPIPQLVMVALIGIGVYMLMIRPQKSRLRAIAAAQAALEPGRQVILTSGIYGTVLHVEQDKLGLEIAPGVHVTVARGAVAKVVDLAAEDASSDDAGTPLT
jgi:preprotein translocase subunit YajC